MGIFGRPTNQHKNAENMVLAITRRRSSVHGSYFVKRDCKKTGYKRKQMAKIKDSSVIVKAKGQECLVELVVEEVISLVNLYQSQKYTSEKEGIMNYQISESPTRCGSSERVNK
mmetsp:Transcript_1039/g.1308  ORF Transcript_1039/g.1308 Transcript_1039/m.1308 type:complete len:114 (+) Transcript_1039:432-773(+)